MICKKYPYALQHGPNGCMNLIRAEHIQCEYGKHDTQLSIRKSLLLVQGMLVWTNRPTPGPEYHTTWSWTSPWTMEFLTAEDPKVMARLL